MMVGAAGDSGHGNMRLLAHNFADQEAERYWARSKTGVLAHPTTTCSPARCPLPNGSMAAKNRATNWGPSVDTQEPVGDIAPPHYDIIPLSPCAAAQTTCCANSSANGHLGSFSFGAVINNSSGSICVRIIAKTNASSLGDLSTSRIAGLCGHLCLTF